MSTLDPSSGENPAGAGAVQPGRRARLARSGAVTVAGQVGKVALTAAGTIVLARILSPADFGLVALVYPLLLFVGAFRDLGLPMAALQSDHLDEMQAGALFWTNLFVTFFVAAVLALMGPVLAWFFGHPELRLITWVMSIGLLATAIVNQHEAHLMRQLRFGLLVKWELVWLLVGVLASIGLAMAGARYWALVAQFLIWQVGRAIMVWIVSDWTPAGYLTVRRSGRSIRHLLSFGAYLTGYRVISHAGRDLDRLLVGYFSGAYALGLYDAALRWARLPLHQIYTPLLGVAVAGLSQVRADAEAYRRSVQKLLTPVLGLSIPVLAFCAVAAAPIILILLGRQWEGAVPLFRLLCIGCIALAALKTMKWLYVSNGQTKRQFYWSIWSTPVIAGSLVVGAMYGAGGVAVGFAASHWALLLPGMAYCLHGSPLRLRQFLSLLARPLFAALLAGVASWAAIDYLPAEHLWAELLLAGIVFAPVYMVAWLALPGGREAASDMLELLQAMRPSRSPVILREPVSAGVDAA